VSGLYVPSVIDRTGEAAISCRREREECVRDHLKNRFMKKLLFLVIVLLLSAAAMAQVSKVKIAEPKSFLAFYGGPSFALGDFCSNDFNNTEAGFAKTGYNLDLSYGYQFHKTAGVAATFFYNRYQLDINKIREVFPTVQADHWKFYGLTAGPFLSYGMSKDIKADLRIMGGMANVNSPKAMVDGETVVKEKWSWAPIFKGGLDLRIGLGENFFVFTGVDYMYTKPEFKLQVTGSTVEEKVHQKISVLNANGGVGIKF
jgi:opacity protein-like surface antigen